MPLSTKQVSSAALFCAVLLSPGTQANQNRTAQDLTEIQQELKKSQQELNSRRKEFEALEQALRRDEEKIADNARALNRLEKQIAENVAQQKKLKAEIDGLEKQKKRLEKLLGAQLKSAYMTGGHDYTKLLLNQQNTAKLERTLSYYNYLNKARVTQLEQLEAIIIQLEERRSALDIAKNQIEQLRQEQNTRRDTLLAAKSKRKQNLTKLTASLNQLQSSIGYLQQNEKTLVATLEELARAETQEITLNGLASSKGTLPWPAKGRLKQRFGKPKHGHLTWKGVVLSDSEGAPIHTVHNGQVVFADWLRGFGWVIVIDHGEGYMSLYGHAQALLKEVGDMVRQGETIALVGQSGGQTDPGLYFEIRHKGRAINPTKWCSRG